jgi:undecaprenyl-diphosphatase
VWGWAVLLVGLALLVKRGSLAAFDRSATQWLEAGRTPALDECAAAITLFGSSPWAVVVVALMVGWWWRSGQGKIAAGLCLAGCCGLLAQAALRFWVAQWRPDAVVPEAMNLFMRYELAGFTSGHAFRSAFLYGWWADRLWQDRARPWAFVGAIGCWLLILLVGLSRVYLHRHWCTDVVGAWLIAMTALAATARYRRQGVG